jgi:hypothetical protein
MNNQDGVTIMVTTNFGTFPVDFTVVKSFGNHTYVLLAQDRIVVAQQKSNTDWIFSTPVDLLSLIPIERVYYKQVNPCIICQG